MPVEKTSARAKRAEMDFGKKIIFTLLGILVAYAIVLLGTMIRNNLKAYAFIGRGDRSEHTLLIEAEAKVTAVPDVAVVNMVVIAKGATVAEAQKQSTGVMNTLTEKLKTLGVNESDIQTTNYNVYPKIKYSPTEGEQADGYEVNQTVTVKIRNLAKAGEVLALAGTVGVNSVGGVTFTIDDPEVYRSQARSLALTKALEKAKQLSAALGVRVVGVVSYSEYQPGDGAVVAYGRGGMGGDAVGFGAPSIAAGTNDVVMHVTVAYEIQ